MPSTKKAEKSKAKTSPLKPKKAAEVKSKAQAGKPAAASNLKKPSSASRASAAKSTIVKSVAKRPAAKAASNRGHVGQEKPTRGGAAAPRATDQRASAAQKSVKTAPKAETKSKANAKTKPAQSPASKNAAVKTVVAKPAAHKPVVAKSGIAKPVVAKTAVAKTAVAQTAAKAKTAVKGPAKQPALVKAAEATKSRLAPEVKVGPASMATVAPVMPFPAQAVTPTAAKATGKTAAKASAPLVSSPLPESAAQIPAQVSETVNPELGKHDGSFVTAKKKPASRAAQSTISTAPASGGASAEAIKVAAGLAAIKAAAKPRPAASVKKPVGATVAAKPAEAVAPETKVPEVKVVPAAPAKPVVPAAKLPETKPAVAAKPAKPGAARQGFKPLEFIVYPAHGVGQIIAIEEQEVAGFKLELFVISFIKDKMILKVPTPKVISVGMRKLAEADVVKKALDTLTGRARIKRTMWSRRAHEYEAKINSGDLVSISEVVRDLYRSDAQPEQSYSERQLYEAALDRIAREIAAVQKLTETESLKLIDGQLQKGPRRSKAEEAESDIGETEEDVEEAA